MIGADMRQTCKPAELFKLAIDLSKNMRSVAKAVCFASFESI